AGPGSSASSFTLGNFFLGVFALLWVLVTYLGVVNYEWEAVGLLAGLVLIAYAAARCYRRPPQGRWVRPLRWVILFSLLIGAYLIITWLFSQDWRFGWSGVFFVLMILHLGLNL